MGLAASELGLLSFLVAVAYWPLKGAGLAALAGLAMMVLGIVCLAKGAGYMVGGARGKREKAGYY
jgi:hypothetical protein